MQMYRVAPRTKIGNVIHVYNNSQTMSRLLYDTWRKSLPKKYIPWLTYQHSRGRIVRFCSLYRMLRVCIWE